MPKLKLSGTDKFVKLPFDPNVIEGLLRGGHEVFHDDDATEKQIDQERRLVFDAFNKRKESDLLGKPKFKAEYERWKNKASPSLQEDDRFSKRLSPPGTIYGGDFLNIKPNPHITNMPEIDPNFLMLTKNRKKSWDL